MSEVFIARKGTCERCGRRDWLSFRRFTVGAITTVVEAMAVCDDCARWSVRDDKRGL